MRHILLSFLFLTACSSVQQTTTSGPLYSFRADMNLQVEKSALYDGMMVWRLAGPVTIGFVSPVNIDRVQITSCARQAVCQSGGYCDSNFTTQKDWLGKVSQTFYYNYAPTDAELNGVCPLYVEAYSKSDLTSWGFIGFRSDEALPATVACNGKTIPYAGMTTCQTKSGLEQSMTFTQKVKAVAEPGCHMSTTDQMKFKFVPDKGFCRATFQGVDAKGSPIYHRLILLGYGSVLVRVN